MVRYPIAHCLAADSRNGLEQILHSSDFVGYSGSFCKHDLVEHDTILSKFQQFAIVMPMELY